MHFNIFFTCRPKDEYFPPQPSDALGEFRRSYSAYMFLVEWNTLFKHIFLVFIFFIPNRRAYLKMSASSEAFFQLKSNFATSHAQICISQWVLGIGDRHLSNFMIDRLSGKMVGIDFGHAFGSASQVRVIYSLMS